MGPTEALAHFVANTHAGDIPKQAMQTAKLVILDVIGVTLSGSTLPAARIITEHVRDHAAAPRAGIIGTKVRTMAPLAALANGTTAFILDYDDDLHGSIHTFPAALAVGEELKINGESLLAAYILGREVCYRLDAALDAGRRKNRGGPTTRGWFSGGTTGSLAATAAAGKAARLNVQQMRTALGIAATLAGGLRRNFGTMAKALHGGNAARNGVTATSLAQKGFSADDSILEAPLGFVSALCLDGECDWDALTKDLGEFFYMEQLPPIKPYPACALSHRHIEGLLALRQKHGFVHEDVESIECDFHVRSLCRTDPQEGIAGHNSMPFLLAVALLDGKIVVEQFTDERMRDPLVRSVISKIKHVPLSGEKSQPEPTDHLTVKLKNGAVYTLEVPQRRTLTTKSEIRTKFLECAMFVLNREDAERLMEAVDRLETLEDIGELMRLMSGDILTTA